MLIVVQNMLVPGSFLMGKIKGFVLEVDLFGNGKKKTEKKVIERRMKWMVAEKEDGILLLFFYFDFNS